MKKSKKESKKKSNILYLATAKKNRNDQSSSDVARSLFSETWRSYLDEVNMVAVNMNKEKENKIDKTKGPMRISLLD